MKPEETVDFHIRRTWQSIARMYNEAAAAYGATMATGFVLLNIDQKRGTPSTALGPRMGMEATSLSRILRSMEEKGLIIRHPNPADGRGVLIFLTEFGRLKRQDAREVVLKFNNDIAEKIPEQKLTHFFEVIEEIHNLTTHRKNYKTRK